MSLLADLLSRAKRSQQKVLVPPNLTRIVQGSSRAKQGMKIKVIVAATVFLILCGFSAIYVTDLYLKPLHPSQQMEPGQETDNMNNTVVTETGSINATPKLKPEPSDEITLTNKIFGSESIRGNSSVRKSDIRQETIARPDKSLIRKQKTESTHVGLHTASQDSTTAGIADDTSRNEKDLALYTAKEYEQKKDYAKANDYYRKALELDSHNYLIMNSLAGSLIKTGSFKDSIFYSMKALDVSPNYVPSLVNLAIANIQTGNLTDGEIQLLKARRIDQSNRTVLFNLGLLYERISNYEESLAVFRKLAELKDISGNLGLARIAEKQGNVMEAEKNYREILSSNAADPATRKIANERLQAITNR